MMRSVCVILLLLAFTSSARAIERKALPAFQLRTLEGGVVTSTQLQSPETRWLIVYVTADCTLCDELLDALSVWQVPGTAERVVVVAGGDSSAALAYLQRRAQRAAFRPEPGGGQPRAFVDADGAARNALAIASSPVLVGVRGGQIEWSLGGVVTDPAAFESVIEGWLQN